MACTPYVLFRKERKPTTRDKKLAFTSLKARAPQKRLVPQINPVQSRTGVSISNTFQPSHRPTNASGITCKEVSVRLHATTDRERANRDTGGGERKRKKEVRVFFTPVFSRCGFPNETFSLRDLDRCEAALSFSFPASAIVLMPIETASGSVATISMAPFQ